METENDDFDLATQGFLAWLPAMGIKVNPKMKVVDLRSEGRGRGIVAGADFREDEVVFSIPRSAILNVETYDNSVAGLSDKGSALPNWLALTIILLTEGLRKGSKWAPYLAVLPRQLDSLIFWSDTELAELQASPVVHKIGRVVAEEMFAKHVLPLNLEGCTVELCHKVASIIMAYAFDIPEEGATNDDQATHEGNEDDLVSDDGGDEKTILSMVPLADILNADADRNNARLCCDNEGLEMRTVKAIAQGEEIFNDYGLLPRSDLLRRYGYVTDNYAAFDVVEISTEFILCVFRSADILQMLHHSPPTLDQENLLKRIEIAEREGVYEESYDISHPSPDGLSIPDELLGLLYLLLLNEEDYQSIVASRVSLPSRAKLSTELVGRVLTVLLRAKESEYGTTANDDQEMIHNEKLSRRSMMALQVRLGEKSVLKSALEEASNMSGNNKRMRIAQAISQSMEGRDGNGKHPSGVAFHATKKRKVR